MPEAEGNACILEEVSFFQHERDGAIFNLLHTSLAKVKFPDGPSLAVDFGIFVCIVSLVVGDDTFRHGNRVQTGMERFLDEVDGSMWIVHHTRMLALRGEREQDSFAIHHVTAHAPERATTNEITHKPAAANEIVEPW